IRDKRTADMSKKSISGVIGITLTIIGFLAKVVYFISRWIAGGNAPVSNMFEFVTFLVMTLVFAFILIYFIYRFSVFVLFALQFVLLFVVYGILFLKEISPFITFLTIIC